MFWNSWAREKISCVPQRAENLKVDQEVGNKEGSCLFDVLHGRGKYRSNDQRNEVRTNDEASVALTWHVC